MNFDRKKFFDAYRVYFGSLTQKQVDGVELLLGFMEKDQWASVQHAAYFLATVKHETANTFFPIHERGNVSYFNKYDAGTRLGRILGNTQPGDGFSFRGRGYVQITGRGNYGRLSRALGLGDLLINDPDKACDPAIAYNIAKYGMEKGAFTGKSIGHYVNDRQVNYLEARRVINGTDKARLIADYATQFEKILTGSVQRVANVDHTVESGDKTKPTTHDKEVDKVALCVAVSAMLRKLADQIDEVINVATKGR